MMGQGDFAEAVAARRDKRAPRFADPASPNRSALS